jgi:hypothetical protein
MTITTVNKKIATAMNDLRLTGKEVDGILNAVKPDLSNGEAKAIAGLLTRVTTKVHAPPGAQICFVPTAEKEAVEKLQKFVGEKNLPVGDNASLMRDAINDQLSRSRLGPPSNKLPRSLDKLMELPLEDHSLPVGGWTRRAYCDVAKKRFYLVETRATQTDNTRVWGPLSLPKAEKPSGELTLSPARTAQIKDSWIHFQMVARFQFQPGGVTESHLGQRFVRVELSRENHPDGYTTSALIPVGALSPTAPVADPNKVTEFYIERTGGLGGLTESFGPVSIR